MIRKPWGNSSQGRGGGGQLGCRQISRVPISSEPRELVINLDLPQLIQQRQQQGRTAEPQGGGVAKNKGTVPDFSGGREISSSCQERIAFKLYV